jgi:hypothetical protein
MQKDRESGPSFLVFYLNFTKLEEITYMVEQNFPDFPDLIEPTAMPTATR